MQNKWQKSFSCFVSMGEEMILFVNWVALAFPDLEVLGKLCRTFYIEGKNAQIFFFFE